MERDRFESLDGLRGVAAIIVAIFHFLCAFVPVALSEFVDPPWPGSDTPLAIFYNGGFAVAVFFVLSGFVVSNSAAKRHLPFLFNILQRYVRFAGPVLASTLVAWLLFKAFPTSLHDLKIAIASPWLWDAYDGNLPSLRYAVLHGSVLVFLRGNSFFNNPLWTMKIELLGSWLLYAVYACTQGRVRILILLAYLAAPLAIWLPELSAFPAGALVREAYVTHRLPKQLSWPALLLGILFGFMMKGFGDRFGLHLPSLFALGQPHGAWHVVAAVFLMIAILQLPALGRLFAGRVARFLGKISFGLYLVHAPLLYTLVAWTYLRLPSHGVVAMAALLLGFLVAVVGSGYLLTIAVDQPVLKAIRSAQQLLKTRRQSAVQGA